MLELAQTLHGYDHGHRLLAEGGTLSDDERSILDRLGDLSGYLPSGVVFDHYYTGFPCGRYYAFACTWLDTGAQRGGTVLTHTLLIARKDIVGLTDLFALAHFHRRPSTAEDRAPYTQVLSVELTPATPIAPPIDRARAALALYIGQRERPILWMDETQPVAIVRYLWQLPVKRWRERLSFCTLSLQERTIEKQPFTFLGLPPQAQGGFHRLAASRAWWRNGHLDHPASFEGDWLDRMVDSGGAQLKRLEREATFIGLPMIDNPGDLATLRKFWQVHEASRERLTAARARVDLLARLWPEVSVDHPEWSRAFEAWLHKLPEAPVEPRPLWELTYMMSKSQLWTLFDRDLELAKLLATVVREELRTRFAQVPELLIQALPALLDQIQREQIAATLYDMLRWALPGGLFGPGVNLTMASDVLTMAAERRNEQLLHCVLEHWRHPAREQVWRVWMEQRAGAQPDPELEDWLHKQLVTLAIEFGDPTLAFSVLIEREDLATALKAAERAALSNGNASNDMRDVLKRLEPDVAFDWCLQCPDELRQVGISYGVELTDHVARDASSLAVRVAGSKHGTRIFARRYLTLSKLEARTVFARAPGLASAMFALVIEDRERVGHDLYKVAFETLTDAQLWTEDMHKCLLSRKSERRTGLNLENDLGVRLLNTIFHGHMDRRTAIRWLALPMVRTWWDELDTYRSRELVRNAPSTALPQLIHVLAPRKPSNAKGSDPAERVLAGFLYLAEVWDSVPHGLIELVRQLVRKASRHAFAEASDDIIELLRHNADRDAQGLRADILLAALTHRIGPALVVETFLDTYRMVMAGGSDARDVTWPVRWTWDRGRALRHALLDTWVEENWPTDDLVSCLGHDRELARRVLMRAFKDSGKSRRFAALMVATLEPGSELPRLWRSIQNS